MAERKVSVTVDEMVQKLKMDPSSRFSKNDFQMLIYAILSDEDFKVKKYLIHNNAFQEDISSVPDALKKFLDKVLKHAGMTDGAERSKVIETFDFSPKDVEWVADAVDEAMHIYTECGKNLRLFRNKMLELSIKKMVRSGRWEGMVSYKKSVVDRASNLAKRNKSAE